MSENTNVPEQPEDVEQRDDTSAENDTSQVKPRGGPPVIEDEGEGVPPIGGA